MSRACVDTYLSALIGMVCWYCWIGTAQLLLSLRVHLCDFVQSGMQKKKKINLSARSQRKIHVSYENFRSNKRIVCNTS